MRTIYFTPQQDITAFELAYIFARVGGAVLPRHGIQISELTWEDMPIEMKRHWSTENTK